MISAVRNSIKRKMFDKNERFYYRFAKGTSLLSETPLVRFQSRTPIKTLFIKRLFIFALQNRRAHGISPKGSRLSSFDPPARNHRLLRHFGYKRHTVAFALRVAPITNAKSGKELLLTACFLR